jgi:spermidine synthase
MAGLALGSFIFGRVADRSKNPLRLYALLQMGIGAYVMLTPLIFSGLSAVQVSIYGALPVGSGGVTVLRVLLSFLVLIVPTTLMGGTLPVIARFFVRREEEVGGGIGNLYFINTLGAVFGAFLAGFVLIPYIGVLASTFLAASIDLAIGVGFYFLQKYKIKPVEQPPPEEEVIEGAPVQPQPGKKQLKRLERDERKRARLGPAVYSRTMKWVVFAGFAFGGLASLRLEVSWTHVLSMVLGSSVYAFSLMLTAFLLGIALGSAIAAKFVDRVRHLWVYFFVVQVLIGIAVVVLNPLLGELPLMFVRVFSGLQQNFWLLQFVEFLLLLLIMLVPTLLMGAAFPIAARIYTDDIEHMGGSVGRLYAGNTFGSMVGPLLTGFLIIPLIGIQWSISLVSIIYMAIAVAVFIVGFRSHLKIPGMVLKGSTRVATAVAGVTVLAVLVTNILIPALGSWDKHILTSGVFLYAEEYYQSSESWSDKLRGTSHLVYYDEGLLATVAVYDLSDGNRVLRIDGKADGSSFGDLTTELLSGHLPMLLHDKPEEVLLIGLGTGITLGAVEIYPSVVSVEAVEIEGAVIEAATYFSEANGDALNNEKLTMIQADARNYVLAQTKADRKYDVITAEPSNPWMAGNSILFTREQFERYERILNDDGIVCQWIHYYSMGEQDLKTVLGTFTDVFPNTSLWRTESDLLLIATKGEQSIDFGALNARLQQEDVLNDLKRVDVNDVYDFLGTFLMGPTALADFADGAPIHTDNNPVLQFSAPQNLHNITSIKDNAWSLQSSAQRIEDIDSFLTNYEDEVNFSEEIQKQRGFFIHYTDAVINLENALNSQREGDNVAVTEYANAVIAALEAILSTGANDAYAHRRLGSIHMAGGELDGSVDQLEKAVNLNPSYAPAWIDLGNVYLIMGQLQEAINSYSSAINLVKDNALLYNMRGDVYLQMDNQDAASADHDKARDLYP